jgi:hypothetical protein
MGTPEEDGMVFGQFDKIDDVQAFLEATESGSKPSGPVAPGVIEAAIDAHRRTPVYWDSPYYGRAPEPEAGDTPWTGQPNQIGGTDPDLLQ